MHITSDLRAMLAEEEEKEEEHESKNPHLRPRSHLELLLSLCDGGVEGTEFSGLCFNETHSGYREDTYVNMMQHTTTHCSALQHIL